MCVIPGSLIGRARSPEERSAGSESHSLSFFCKTDGSVSQCRSWTVSTDVEDPRSFTSLSPPNKLLVVVSLRWAQQYEIVVATSVMMCKNGFASHTGACAIPPT